MRKIFKYPIRINFHGDLQSLTLPKGSTILSAQAQNPNPVIWALVNPEETQEEHRVIRTFGTGQTIDSLESSVYISTIQLPMGLVMHVFEVTI